MNPENLLFSKTHEWVHVDTDARGAKVATVGISAFAVEALTDLVHIELPPVGRNVKAGEPFGEIESVKAVSELFSPVTGEVTEVNATLADNPERVNDSPYAEGWMAKIRLSDPGELDRLMTAEQYDQYTQELS